MSKKSTDTVGEFKTGCKTGQESTILIRPKALIRAFGGFANSILTVNLPPIMTTFYTYFEGVVFLLRFDEEACY